MKVIVEKVIERKAHPFKKGNGFVYTVKCSGLVDGVTVSGIMLKTFDEATHSNLAAGREYEVVPDELGAGKHDYMLKEPPRKGPRKGGKPMNHEMEVLKVKATLAAGALQAAAMLVPPDPETGKHPGFNRVFDALFKTACESVFGNAAAGKRAGGGE